MDKLSSETIAFLRFPLIVGIVFIHTPITIIDASASGVGYDLYRFLTVICSKVLSSICVPSFFFISGYLFFAKIESYKLVDYQSKLKSRFKTLLIPYLLWNLIPIVILVLKLGLQPHFWESVSNLPWWSFFWDYKRQADVYNLLGWPLMIAFPIDGPLWFVRDLIICTLASPLLYMWVKHVKIYGVAILGILYVFSIWPYTIIFMMGNSLFFFSLGSYLGLGKKKLYNSGVLLPLLLTALLLALLSYYSYDILPYAWYRVIKCIFCVVGVFCVFNITACLIHSCELKIPHVLSGSVFFIYASHTLYINGAVSGYLLPMLIPEREPISLTLRYLLAPFITITICTCLYLLLKKVAPKCLSVMNGGRL